MRTPSHFKTMTYVSLQSMAAVLMLASLVPTSATPAQTAPSQTPIQRRAEYGQLDINSASIAELKALPGMGVAYARRIVENRPYSSKNQLVTRGVLPQTVYNAIRDRIVAHRIQSAR